MDQARMDVIEKLYASVCDDQQWEPALRTLLAFVGGEGVAHMASNPSRNIITAAEAVAVPPTQLEQFQTHFADKEIRLAPAVAYGVGVPLIDWRHLVPVDQLRRSVIFNEFLVPNDIPYILGIWVKKTPTASASLSFQGSTKRGPFTDADAERLRNVVPHLLRAYEARQLLKSARATRFAYARLLDALPFGVILLDSGSRVIDLTAPAERVLRENFALGFFEGRLRAIDSTEQRLLSNAIDTVCRNTLASAGATIHLRRGCREQLTLMVVPVPRDTPAMLEVSARCMVILIDPRIRLRAQAVVLQRAFSLSHAEAWLAVEMFRSPTLRDAAIALGRSYNTCKTQMKSIYAKMQVKSQVELTQKIMIAAIANSVP